MLDENKFVEDHYVDLKQNIVYVANNLMYYDLYHHIENIVYRRIMETVNY